MASASDLETMRRSRLPIALFAGVMVLLGIGSAVLMLSRGDSNQVSDTDTGEAIGSADVWPTSGEGQAPAARVSATTSIADSAVIASTTTGPVVVASSVVAVAPAEVAPPELPIERPIVGDLELAQSITRPACDEQFITVVASAIDPLMYQDAVGDSLGLYPGSQYLKTSETCSSLRPAVDGRDIYVVYFGPFATSEEACSARTFGPADAYVRVLSLVVPDTHKVDC